MATLLERFMSMSCTSSFFFLTLDVPSGLSELEFWRARDAPSPKSSSTAAASMPASASSKPMPPSSDSSTQIVPTTLMSGILPQ